MAAARKLLTAKARAATGLFLVEGPHAVAEALSSPRHDVVEVFVTPARAGSDALTAARDDDVRITVVTDRVAASLSDTVTPQGVVAVVRPATEHLRDVLAGSPRLLVVLAGVADPGNAGAVIRTADAAGADAVVLAGETVDPHNPKCVRATAGSAFHLPVVRTASAVEAVEAIRAVGLLVLATTATGEEDIYALAAAGRLSGPVAVVLGSEAHGLSSETRAAADLTVRIPIRGRAESLNLGAAAAVCIYAVAQAQHRPESP